MSVAKAGHNLYDPKHGGWIKSVEVNPCRNRGRMPFFRHPARMTDVVPAWKEHGHAYYDCGAIFLDHYVVDESGRPLGDWMTFAERPDEMISGLKVNNLGHPVDRDSTFSTMY